MRGMDAAANTVTAFEDNDIHVVLLEHGGGAQAGYAGAYHNDHSLLGLRSWAAILCTVWCWHFHRGRSGRGEIGSGPLTQAGANT